MCLERKILKKLCKTYPNSYYVLKQKALLRRAFIRNSKTLVEEEIKSSLSESLTKRSFSSKQRKRKEIEELAHKSHSVGGNQNEFHFNMQPVEVDEFEQEGSVAFEKQSGSFRLIRELPEVHPGGKMNGQAIATFKRKLSNISIITKKKVCFKEKLKKMETQSEIHINDVLDDELKQQHILQRMQSLKVFLPFNSIFVNVELGTNGQVE